MFNVNSSTDATYTEFLVHGTPLKFQIDTGAEMSLMSETQQKKIGAPHLNSTELTPVNFDEP